LASEFAFKVLSEFACLHTLGIVYLVIGDSP
jgi:hypothetical protein